MKKILITGRNSYIGNALSNWLRKDAKKYEVEQISVYAGMWETFDFSQYDTVVHVAAIVHKKEAHSMRNLYRKVNMDLPYAIAKKARREQVKQFIFMSSISVYGLTTGTITKQTPLLPNTLYGKSKKEAEKRIARIASKEFAVAIVRAPMVYGQGCPGNYRKLSQLAKKVVFVPTLENKRSMIYIDNLCECIKWLMDENRTGIYFPQNKGYLRTSDIIRLIMKHHGKRAVPFPMINVLLHWLANKNRLMGKLFGDLIYAKELWDEQIEKYNVVDVEKSIRLSEEFQSNEEQKKCEIGRRKNL